MKKIAKIFALFIAVLGLVSLVACKKDPEPVQPYSALGSFVDGGDEIYTIATNTTSELTFSYEKADEAYSNSYIYTNVNTSLKAYKKLVITTSGAGTMAIQLHNADSSVVKEVKINVVGTAYTYEWNLMNDSAFLDTVKKIVIVAGPGKAEGVGSITLTSLTFDEGVAGATGQYIISTDFNNIPDNINEYNGKDEVFNFNAKWENSHDETYVIEQDSETKEVKVKYDKEKNKDYIYTSMQSNVKGDFSKFDYVVLVVNGDAGTKLMVKAATGVEKNFALDGTKQTLVLDISGMTDEQKKSISAITLFGNPNTTDNGKFTIYDAYMTETSPIEIEEEVVNEYDGTSEIFDVSDYWYDGGDAVYTVSDDANGVKVYYKKASTQTYSTLKAYVNGVPEKFNFLVLEVTGADAAKVTLKAANDYESETKEIGTDKVQIVIAINTMTAEQKAALKEIIIFGHIGTGGTGTFVINKAYYAVEVEGVELPSTNVYEGGNDFDINNYWSNNNVDDYTVNEEQWVTTISWTKTQQYAAFKTTVEGVTDQFNILRFTVRGTAGQKLLVKPNDTMEYPLTLSETDTTYYIPVPANLVNLFIIANPEFETVGAEGSCVISQATLIKTYEANGELAGALKDSVDNVYTVSTENNITTVSFSKTNQEWASMFLNLVPIMSKDYNVSASIKLTNVVLPAGVEKLQVLIKFNNDNAYQNFQFIEEGENTIEINSIPESISQVHVFLGAGQQNVSGEAELSLVIEPKPESIEYVGTYEDRSGNGYYTFAESENGVEVSYNIQQASWFAFAVVPTETIKNVEKMILVVEGNVRILVKPNDAHEKGIDLNGETIIEVEVGENLRELIIIVSPQVISSGKITVKSINYVLGDKTSNEYESGSTFDVNHFWSDNATGDYVVEEGDTETTATWTKTGAWHTFKNAITGVSGQFNYMKFTVKGTEGQTLLVKPNDLNSYQYEIILTNEFKTYYIPLPTDCDLTQIHIMGNPGDANIGSTGTCTISEAVLMNLTNLSSDFSSKLAGDAEYTVSVVDGVTNIAFEKGHDVKWASIYVTALPLTTADHDIVVKINLKELVVTGEQKLQVLVKFNNDNAFQNFQWITVGDTEINITAVPAVIHEVRLFLGADQDNISGKVEVSMVAVEKEIDTTPVTYSVVDSGENVYTLTGDINAGSVTAAYVKTGTYNSMKVLPGKNVIVSAIKMVVSSDSAVKLLVKPNDGHDLELELTPEGTEFTWTFNEPISLNLIYMFIAPGVESGNGTFTIVSFEVTEA